MDGVVYMTCAIWWFVWVTDGCDHQEGSTEVSSARLSKSSRSRCSSWRAPNIAGEDIACAAARQLSFMPPTCGLQPQHAQDSSATRPLQRHPKLNAALERVGVGWYLGSGLGRVPGDARGVRCALSVLLLLLRSVLDRPEPLGLSRITTKRKSELQSRERHGNISACLDGCAPGRVGGGGG